MLLHLGLGYQMLERILLLKVLIHLCGILSRFCSLILFYFLFFVLFCFFFYFLFFVFLFLNQMIDYGLIILVHWELNLQDILQIEYLLHIRFIRAKLHCLWLLFSQLSPSWMYDFFFGCFYNYSSPISVELNNASPHLYIFCCIVW